MSEAAGACLCGQVRHRVITDAAQSMVCHCRACQKQSGSAFSLVFTIPEDAIEIRGETKVFEHQSDSGSTVMRHFCPSCGSPIISNRHFPNQVFWGVAPVHTGYSTPACSGSR